MLCGHPENFCSECTWEEEGTAGLKHHEMHIRNMKIQEEVYLRRGLGMIVYTIMFKCLLREARGVSSLGVLVLQSCGWQGGGWRMCALVWDSCPSSGELPDQSDPKDFSLSPNERELRNTNTAHWLLLCYSNKENQSTEALKEKQTCNSLPINTRSLGNE